VCLGKAVDQRSDIFALGIVLFESLTGRMPFNDASPLKLMLEIVESDIPDIREFNPDVDEETVRILGRMLEKNPSDRYQSCDELNADLHRHPLTAGRCSSSRASRMKPPRRRWSARRRRGPAGTGRRAAPRRCRRSVRARSR
jgi:serine/threonine-protein kinase